MSKTSSRIAPLTASCKLRTSVLPSGWLGFIAATTVLLLMGLAPHPVRAESPDDAYLRIYRLLEQAETLEASGKTAPALAKYQEIHLALKVFQRANPNWDPKLVALRLRTVSDKVQVLNEKLTTPAEVATPDTASKAGAKAGPAGGGSPIKLLQAGAEPRKALRRHPKAGDKQQVNLSLKLAIDMKMGELPNQGTKLPPMEMSMAVTVKNVSPEGNITYDWSIADVSVKEGADTLPAVAEVLKASLAGVKGLTGSGTLSDRGVSQQGEGKTSAATNPQAQQAVEQMKDALTQALTVFPEEPVGLGAKWEIKAALKSQGMAIDQTATHEVTALDGERVTIKSTLTQTAPKQKVQNPAMPGLNLDLTKFTGAGSSTCIVDLGQLYPVETTATSRTDLTMDVNIGGQKQSMAMKIDTNVRLEGK